MSTRDDESEGERAEIISTNEEDEEKGAVPTDAAAAEVDERRLLGAERRGEGGYSSANNKGAAAAAAATAVDDAEKKAAGKPEVVDSREPLPPPAAKAKEATAAVISSTESAREDVLSLLGGNASREDVLSLLGESAYSSTQTNVENGALATAKRRISISGRRGKKKSLPAKGPGPEVIDSAAPEPLPPGMLLEEYDQEGGGGGGENDAASADEGFIVGSEGGPTLASSQRPQPLSSAAAADGGSEGMNLHSAAARPAAAAGAGAVLPGAVSVSGSSVGTMAPDRQGGRSPPAAEGTGDVAGEHLISAVLVDPVDERRNAVVGTVYEATAVTDDDSSKRRRCMLAAFVVFVLAAVVIVAVVLATRPPPQPTPAPPSASAEDQQVVNGPKPAAAATPAPMPTAMPTSSFQPSSPPSANPTLRPTSAPSSSPTGRPTPVPSAQPSAPLTWRVTGSFHGRTEGDDFGHSIAISDGGDVVAVSSPLGYVRVYGLMSDDVGGGWSQMGYTIYGEIEDEDQDYSDFGSSVSLSANGTVLAASNMFGGMQADGTYYGKVFVYRFDVTKSDWVQFGQVLQGVEKDEEFGRSVSLSADGTVLAVGAWFSSQVRIFRLEQGQWSQIGESLVGEKKGDMFGNSVSLSGDGSSVVVGAPWNSGGAGHARVYGYSNGTWLQIGQDIDGEGKDDFSGESVSMSRDGHTVAVGAEHNCPIGACNNYGSEAGHVRVFHLEGGDWSQIGQDIDGHEKGEWFGFPISLSGDGEVVVGRGSSLVRVYGLVGNATHGVWSQLGQDIHNEDGDFDEADRSIAISGDGTVLAVGFVSERPEAGGGAGIVRVYQLGRY